jgi:hypothetical protein
MLRRRWFCNRLHRSRGKKSQRFQRASQRRAPSTGRLRSPVRTCDPAEFEQSLSLGDLGNKKNHVGGIDILHFELHALVGPKRRSASLCHNSQPRLAFLFIGDSHMPKGPFIASQFVPTEWSSAADKAVFGNTFLHFVESGWKRSLFTKGFYQRLSNCFGHIAHYDIHGFYETWFTSDKDRLEFLKNASTWACYGDPKFTFSDVERALRQQIHGRNYVALYEVRAAEELRTAETMILRRLEAKYRSPTAATPSDMEPREEAEPTSPATRSVTVREPVQISLF